MPWCLSILHTSGKRWSHHNCSWHVPWQPSQKSTCLVGWLTHMSRLWGSRRQFNGVDGVRVTLSLEPFGVLTLLSTSFFPTSGLEMTSPATIVTFQVWLVAGLENYIHVFVTGGRSLMPAPFCIETRYDDFWVQYSAQGANDWIPRWCQHR